jgi:hypothetical protein
MADALLDVSRDELPRQPPAFVVRRVIAMRLRLLALADKLIPPQFVVFERSFGDARARLLAAVVRLGVPEALGNQSRTARDVAAELGLDADMLHRVLRALALEGIVRMDRSGRFSLTKQGRCLLPDHPDSMNSWIRYWSTESNRAAWDRVEDVIRTGAPAFPAVHGMSVWQWFGEHQDEGRLFASAMRRLTEFDAPDIVALYPWPKGATVCDVAGGAGTLLSRILQSRSDLRGVLVEAPVVLGEAEKVFTERGVRDRVELAEGDIFSEVVATADLYLLKNVLHDYDDETGVRILRTVRAAMPAGATLVVIESLQEPNEPTYPVSMADLQMGVICDRGRERSRAELQAMLRHAGLTPTTVHVSGAGIGLVAGRA